MLELVLYGDDEHNHLGTPCLGPTEPEKMEDAWALGKEMVKCMREWQGVGLASNQVGRGDRGVIVIDSKAAGSKFRRKPLIMVNPELVDYSEELMPEGIVEEMCLSIPGETFCTRRPREATVRWMEKHRPGTRWKWRKMKHTFLLYEATIILHEIDHLAGKTLVDTLTEEDREKFNAQHIKEISE